MQSKPKPTSLVQVYINAEQFHWGHSYRYYLRILW